MGVIKIGDRIEEAVTNALGGIDGGMIETWIGIVRYSTVIDDEVVTAYRVIHSTDNDFHRFVGMGDHIIAHACQIRDDSIEEED